MSNAETEEQLVALFMPALVAVLHAKETAKGSPLSEEEVLETRDNAACMMVGASHAETVAQSRGYFDLDPENIWEEWQTVRIQLQE